VALCDVDERSLQRAAAEHPKAKQFRDFRKLLESPGIDAVVVTTPDHTHAVAAMMAMRAGRHVYCEKPLTHSVYEARQMTLAAREHGIATQMGNGGHSSRTIRECVEWVRSGTIGPVREVHAWSNRPIWPQGIARPADRPRVPDWLNWELWLGPAPERPYHPAYHPFKWRGFWDFGTGALGDMGCHIMDAAFWALELGAPTSVEAESSGVNRETAPEWSRVRYEFPARGDRPAVRLTWHDGGRKPELPVLPEGQELSDNGSLFIGDGGMVLYERGRPRLLPESLMKDFTPPPETLPRSIGHYAEWIAACKGGPKAGSNFDYAGPLTEMVLLGNVALRLGRKIEWDGAGLRVTNAPEAARWVRREYRNGWSLTGHV
jgi:predicted dehydrogenase